MSSVQRPALVPQPGSRKLTGNSTRKNRVAYMLKNRSFSNASTNSYTSDPKSVRHSIVSNFTGINNTNLNSILSNNNSRKSFSELVEKIKPTNPEADAFVKEAFTQRPTRTTDLASRFPTYKLLAGGKSGAKVYKVTGTPKGHPHGTYILKLYHARHHAAYVNNPAHNPYFSKLVFALSPGDGPNYEKAMNVLHKIDEKTFHNTLQQVLETLQENNALDPQSIISLIKTNYSAYFNSLVALAQNMIHYFRALKDVEVCMLLQSTPVKVAPALYEYGFIDQDPFDHTSHKGITCYNVTEFVQGMDFSKFSSMMHPSQCQTNQYCDAPENIRYYLAASFLFRIAYYMDIFNNHFNKDKPVGCHRDLHPGNIQILQKPEHQSYTDYWNQEEIITVGQTSYKVIGPQIVLIDFDLSISENPLINRNYECKRLGNFALNKILKTPNFIGASFQFMRKHSNAAKALAYMRKLAQVSPLNSNIHQVSSGEADVFAWKVLVTSLLDYVPQCKTFIQCIETLPQFQPMIQDENLSKENINNVIQEMRTENAFTLDIPSSGGRRRNTQRKRSVCRKRSTQRK